METKNVKQNAMKDASVGAVNTTPTKPLTQEEQEIANLDKEFKSQLELYKKARSEYVDFRHGVIAQLKEKSRESRELRATMLETYGELKKLRAGKRVAKLQHLIEAAKKAAA